MARSSHHWLRLEYVLHLAVHFKALFKNRPYSNYISVSPLHLGFSWTKPSEIVIVFHGKLAI